MTLLDALTRAARIAKRGNTLPILNNVLLEPDENGITVTATDLEMRYQATVEGLTITEPFTVDCNFLLKVLKTVKNVQRFEYDKDKEKLYVNGIELNTLPSDEFPVSPIETVDLDEYVEVPLKRLEHLKKAMSEEETRYNIRGVFVDTEKGNLVATDGARLHLTPNITAITAPAAPAIIPRDAVEFLHKTKAASIWLPKKKEKKKELLWFADNEILIVRPVDGTFPDYQNVIPNKFAHKYTIRGNELKQALKECIGIIERGREPVVIFKGNTVTAENINTGKINIQLHGKGEFPETGIGFNPIFLMDTISGDGEIVIEINSHDKPVKVTMVGDDVVNIIMPVRMPVIEEREETEEETTETDKETEAEIAEDKATDNRIAQEIENRTKVA